MISSAVVAHAQDTTAREVVQPLPSQDVQRLNRSLMRLAKRPKNLNALLEAGDAALKVGDLDAAIGFYGRAQELSPQDARVKLGMASVFIRSGRPVDALPLFAAAQTAGAEARDVLPDRALAFDMVGDNEAAQATYRRAIALDGDNTEAKRRLALSYAISGNQAAFEETLRPLLDKRDFASFRTRAFGLAIMGEQDRAAAIVDAVMPRDLASRITPYLAYMPRLTKAQQAAAANLGIFPRAADIGREDPRIAAYVGGTSPVNAASARAAGSRLEPAGQPLGAPKDAASQPVTERVQVSREIAQSVPANVSGSASAELSSNDASGPRPGFDLARVRSTSSSATSAPPSAMETASVADAFADMGGESLPSTASGDNAVDLAAIEIPREAPPQPAVQEPKEPDHPRRIWVQLATGRDVSALKFDWRRFSRRASDVLDGLDPHVTPWGQANRLLAGPVETRQQARDLVNALKQKGLDTFSYVSPEGTEIQELK